MNYKNCRKFLWLFWGVCIALALASSLLAATAWLVSRILLGAAVVVLLVGVILCSKYYRCPHCDRAMPINSGKLTHCPHCGGKL